ncbi:MAG: flagellar basal-body rod protein FlgG [Gemmatimonadetes bacterium]|nr:flagellar basal-body rod protein FlgG [Gemmatimonadota bacterium]MBI3568671.1 flagellar basal-body rod protein FlgG [Gemmatimonadota bacterium]
MDPALNTAATGMMAQQTRTDVIANNLANVNTTGFKRSRAHFEDLLYQMVQGSAAVNGTDATATQAIQVGRGTRLAGVERNHSQGALEQTSRPLDLAIQGDGFFQVQLPNGQTSYTRDGSFQISDQGALVTSEGYTVVPGVKLPQNISNLTIAANGIVTANVGTDGKPTELGRIEIARFANPAGLQSIGNNLYTASPTSGDPTTGYPADDGAGTLSQGYLESSNVEVVQEMVDMISAQRAYELNSKAVQNSESMAQISNNLLR